LSFEYFNTVELYILLFEHWKTTLTSGGYCVVLLSGVTPVIIEHFALA